MDVRQIPTTKRHALIFAQFDSLSVGEELTLIVDHEPRPLRAQFSELRPRTFMWMQRFLGNDTWVATIRRVDDSGPDDDITAFLARCPITQNLSVEMRRGIADRATALTFPRHTAVVEQDQDWPYIGIVRSGSISAILASADGREQTLYDIFPTEAFNEISMLDGGATISRFVAATKEAQVVLLPASTIDEFFTNKETLRAVAVLAGQRSRLMIQRFSEQSSRPIIARVASMLLAFAPPASGLAPVLATLEGMTQIQMATSAGTVKEVFSRALAELELAGAIRRLRGRITHLDRSLLTKIARSP